MQQKNNDFGILYNKDFRRLLKGDPKQYAEKLGYDNLGDGVEVSIKFNTADTFYVVINPNAPVGIDLGQINAAGAAGTIGTIACASTAATFTSTLSTGGSAGSVGSASTK